MTFWLDAQLPPSLAAWLSSTFGADAHALRDADDREIFDAARAWPDTVIVSNDSDFVDLVMRLGAPHAGALGHLRQSDQQAFAGGVFGTLSRRG